LKNILFITAEIHPNSAQGVRYVILFKHLSQHYEITHLTYNSRLFEPGNCKNISVNNTRMNNKLLAILFKVKKYLFNKFSFPDRFIFEIKRYNRIIKQILNNNHFEAMIIGMTPFSFYKVGKHIRNLKPEINLIADLSDPFAGSVDVIKHGAYLKKRRKTFEKKYLKYFDKIVVLNEKIKTFYYETFSLPEEMFAVLEQGVDENFLAAFKTQYPQTAQKTNGINLIYAGGFYKGFREPFNLYKSIEESLFDIHLDIYGGIKKKFLPNKSDKIIYHGLISNSELVQKYASADVVVMIDNSFGIQVPGKTIECLAISKPILFIYENSESPTLQYVREATGIIICKNEITDIKKALAIISEHNTEVVKSFDYSRYTWIYLVDKYMENVIE